jgi:hypothetical protein
MKKLIGLLSRITDLSPAEVWENIILTVMLIGGMALVHFFAWALFAQGWR